MPGYVSRIRLMKGTHGALLTRLPESGRKAIARGCVVEGSKTAYFELTPYSLRHTHKPPTNYLDFQYNGRYTQHLESDRPGKKPHHHHFLVKRSAAKPR